MTPEQIAKETKGFDYNDFLAWFRKKTVPELMESSKVFRAVLPIEGMAAYARWREILENPSKVDKLLQGQRADGNCCRQRTNLTRKDKYYD